MCAERCRLGLLFGFIQQHHSRRSQGVEFDGYFADACSKKESNNEAATASGITNGEESADPWRRNMPSAGEGVFASFCRLYKRKAPDGARPVDFEVD
jgi:hypothetical protein